MKIPRTGSSFGRANWPRPGRNPRRFERQPQYRRACERTRDSGHLANPPHVLNGSELSVSPQVSSQEGLNLNWQRKFPNPPQIYEVPRKFARRGLHAAFSVSVSKSVVLKSGRPPSSRRESCLWGRRCCWGHKLGEAGNAILAVSPGGSMMLQLRLAPHLFKLCFTTSKICLEKGLLMGKPPCKSQR